MNPVLDHRRTQPGFLAYQGVERQLSWHIPWWGVFCPAGQKTRMDCGPRGLGFHPFIFNNTFVVCMFPSYLVFFSPKVYGSFQLWENRGHMYICDRIMWCGWRQSEFLTSKFNCSSSVQIISNDTDVTRDEVEPTLLFAVKVSDVVTSGSLWFRLVEGKKGLKQGVWSGIPFL